MSGDRITTLAGIEATEALALRADIFAMTEAAHAAVLTPKETGAFSHSMRAALAARIARLNGRDAPVRSLRRRPERPRSESRRPRFRRR